MIITKKKPQKEVLESLSGYGSVFVLGCGICATVCGTGGEREVAEMKRLLEKGGKRVTGTFVAEGPCNKSRTKREVKIPKSECVLSLSCGVGCAAVSDIYNLPTVPGLDTLFLGTIGRDSFNEHCVLCGECVLADTGGICPVARCAKGLLNGPCGGSKDGKCEVNTERDCAWVLIYKRLSELKQLDKMRKYVPPKNYELELKPQEKGRGRK